MSEISSKSNNINISNNIDISNNYGSTIASSSSNDNNIINSFINNVEEYDLFTENGVNTISQKKILETWHDFFAKTLKELQDTRDAINDELNGYINTDISDKYDYYSKKYPLLEIDNKIAYTLGGEYHFLSPDEFKLNHFGTTDDNNIGAYGDVLDYQALNVDFNEYTRQYNEFIKEISGTTYDEYKNKIAELDQDILSNKSAKYAVDQQLKEIPYLEKMQTDDYNNFVNNNINNIENIINGHRPVGNIHALGGYDNAIDLSNYDNYKEIMSNDDKCMYAYLLETEGVTVAEKYLDDIQDRLNQAKGAKEAEEFIRSISKNPDASYEDLVIDPTLWNGAKTAGKGFLDGIETFGEGIENIFATEGMMSDNQYAQMAILQKLNGQGVLSETYEISTSIGNMAVPTAISTIISIVATPAAGAAAAKILGATSMGISAAGNSKNDALVKGNTLFASTIYGVLNGVSETTLGYFLGNLPGLTKVSELSLRGMIREGAEEFIQEYVDAGARALVLGESINLDDIAPDALKSFLYGMITSGIMNGGQVGINATYNGAKYVFNNLNDLISFTDKFTSKTSSNNTEIKESNKINFDSNHKYYIDEKVLNSIANSEGSHGVRLISLFNNYTGRPLTSSEISEVESILKDNYSDVSKFDGIIKDGINGSKFIFNKTSNISSNNDSSNNKSASRSNNTVSNMANTSNNSVKNNTSFTKVETGQVGNIELSSISDNVKFDDWLKENLPFSNKLSQEDLNEIKTRFDNILKLKKIEADTLSLGLKSTDIDYANDFEKASQRRVNAVEGLKDYCNELQKKYSGIQQNKINEENSPEIKVKMSENNSSIMYEKQIINDIYFAINSHMSKYNCSFSEMIDILQRMIRDQNYLYLTNNNSARDIIRQYDFTQLSSAINNIILTNNNAVNDINFAINSLMQRQNCSYEDGLNAIKKIIDTNSFIYMTRYNNARNILMNYDISQLTLAYNTIIDNDVKKGLKSPIKFNNNRYNVLNTNLSDYFASFNNNSVGHNYGTDQGGIFELSYYQIDGTNIKLSYREIQDMIKRGDVIPHITKIGTNSYFELKEYIRYKYGFTDNEASIMMNCIDSTGACSYATVCNEIFSYFRANENDFERAFGYSMYTTDEFGNKILNSNKLLMDLYIFANTDVNGGSLLSSTPDGRVFYFNKNALSQNKDIFGRRQLDSEQQKYLSGIRGKNVDLINDFLNSRGYAYSSNIIARCANINNELISNINNRLNNGEGVSLGIYSSGSEIRMLSTDKNIMNSSTKTWGEGGGHSVFVTGMNSQGFIISSWGNEYIIPYADLNENARYIITSGNIYNIGR